MQIYTTWNTLRVSILTVLDTRGWNRTKYLVTDSSAESCLIETVVFTHLLYLFQNKQQWTHSDFPVPLRPPTITLDRSSPEDVDAAVAVGEEEHVVVIVPRDLVDLELELLLCPRAVSLGIDEGHHVVLVAHGDGLAVGAPADVDVLTWSATLMKERRSTLISLSFLCFSSLCMMANNTSITYMNPASYTCLCTFSALVNCCT